MDEDTGEILGMLSVGLDITAQKLAQQERDKAARELAELSTKLSKYLSPQVYDSIFSGDWDVELKTTRKKLTVFFSDIKDFTTTTEDMQPEDLTALLNSYFTEMSLIALEYGATIDKFIGDAMLMFFGDPRNQRGGRGRQDLRTHGRRHAETHGRTGQPMAQSGVREAFPHARRHQHGVLQRGQLRISRPHGLHHHRRRG